MVSLEEAWRILINEIYFSSSALEPMRESDMLVKWLVAQLDCG